MIKPHQIPSKQSNQEQKEQKIKKRLSVLENTSKILSFYAPLEIKSPPPPKSGL